MYENFLEFCEEQGLEFPCTAHQFFARAADFLREIGGNEQDIDALMTHGVCPGWKDD